jgi:hypothetical protein
MGEALRWRAEDWEVRRWEVGTCGGGAGAVVVAEDRKERAREKTAEETELATAVTSDAADKDCKGRVETAKEQSGS